MRPLEWWASPEPTFARLDALRTRDQLAETGHDVRPDDAERIAVLGVGASRVPVLWERAAPRLQAPDFGEPARRLDALRRCGVEPIVTLLHHGSGPHATDLLDAAFPALFAEYAEAAARRFPWVRRWTPINEPLTTARFSTLYGVWYPNLRDDAAFGRALLHETLAQQAAMRRIRAVVPEAEFVLTEDLQRFAAADDAVADYTRFLRERVYLSAELVAGRVGPGHPLFAFLTARGGLTAGELDALRAGAVEPDLVAFNHYPHSERYLFDAGGRVGDVPAVYVAGQPSPRCGPLLREAARRLRLPLALGEVHVRGDEHERVRWLAQHVADVQALRDAGVDVRAIGVWAAFGMVDWHSLLRERARVVEDGIYTFAGANGTPQPTAVAGALRALCAGTEPRSRAVLGWWERPERALPVAALLASAEAGIPEGEHLLAGDPQPV